MFVAKRNILGDTKQKFWYTEISWWDKSRFDHPGTKSNRSITRNDSKVTSIDAFDLIIGLSQRHAFSPYTRRFKAANRPEYRAHQLPSRMGDRIQFAIFPIRPAFIISPCKKKKKKKKEKEREFDARGVDKKKGLLLHATTKVSTWNTRASSNTRSSILKTISRSLFANTGLISEITTMKRAKRRITNYIHRSNHRE